uniref:Uncharacterized protein orf184 n=1 Tax=Chlorokybus atmophyticus TaxID=3144 RepID=A6YE78_CHLAT|nr:hypothetical protein Chatpmp06 [Chlorokybus atmophyticus]ABO15131.1 hypothetical protein [Chlorokybus atmophyticus]
MKWMSRFTRTGPSHLQRPRGGRGLPLFNLFDLIDVHQGGRLLPGFQLLGHYQLLHVMQSNTIQYNTIQCNAMQCNAGGFCCSSSAWRRPWYTATPMKLLSSRDDRFVPSALRLPHQRAPVPLHQLHAMQPPHVDFGGLSLHAMQCNAAATYFLPAYRFLLNSSIGQNTLSHSRQMGGLNRSRVA